MPPPHLGAKSQQEHAKTDDFGGNLICRFNAIRDGASGLCAPEPSASLRRASKRLCEIGSTSGERQLEEFRVIRRVGPAIGCQLDLYNA
jgi:hypothetical protein